MYKAKTMKVDVVDVIFKNSHFVIKKVDVNSGCLHPLTSTLHPPTSTLHPLIITRIALSIKGYIHYIHYIHFKKETIT